MRTITFVHDTVRYLRQLVFPAVLAFAALPAAAETADAGSVEARVDRLLWQLINDERYSHLQVAANYERIRARLLDETCFVSAAPCAHADRLLHHGRLMSTEITPEQAALIDQLIHTLRNTSVSIREPSAHLLISSAE